MSTLKDLFTAFANLYGIIALFDVMYIIDYLDIEIDENELSKLMDECLYNDEHNFFTIGSNVWIHGKKPKNDYDNLEILVEYLYMFDDCEYYDKLKKEQHGKPLYIPKTKEDLLMYADQCYVEENKKVKDFKMYLKNQLLIYNYEDMFSEIVIITQDNPDLNEVIEQIKRTNPMFNFKSFNQIQEFAEKYSDFANNLRLQSNRGYTPHELFTMKKIFE